MRWRQSLLWAAFDLFYLLCCLVFLGFGGLTCLAVLRIVGSFRMGSHGVAFVLIRDGVGLCFLFVVDGCVTGLLCTFS